MVTLNLSMASCLFMQMTSLLEGPISTGFWGPLRGK